jgi:hypothetical protein
MMLVFTYCAAAWLLLTQPAGAQVAPPKPAIEISPDVQTIERAILTRVNGPVMAADVDRLIEVVFKIGARIEGSLSGTSLTESRAELDRIRDSVAALHGRVRRGDAGDAATYQQLQKQLLALAQRVGSPLK